MESLIYDTLSSKSSITMYQDGHHLENNYFIMARCYNTKKSTNEANLFMVPFFLQHLLYRIAQLWFCPELLDPQPLGGTGSP